MARKLTKRELVLRTRNKIKKQMRRTHAPTFGVKKSLQELNRPIINQLLAELKK
ncbi:MAG: hypothetical protein NZ108_04280 [Bacteroidia bacterium]|nr:hypothetical protein [Bacteroidia bacterium]